MAVECAPGPLGFHDRIDMENDMGDLFPISAIRLRIEHAEIRHDVFLVIGRQDGIARSVVRDIGIERWKGHRSQT